MNVLAIIVLSLPPAAFWLWFFLRRNRYRPVPLRALVSTFGLGMAATIPSFLIEWVLLDQSHITPSTLVIPENFGAVVLGMVVVVGPVEEASKFAACWIGARRSMYFDEPADGLVHGVAAALGFATLENIVYMLAFGEAVILIRGPLSTAAHIVFASVWAYALGRHILRHSFASIATVLFALAVGAFLHGAFNVTASLHPLLGLPFLAIGVFFGVRWTLRRFDWAQEVSTYRLRRNAPLFACRQCGVFVRVTAKYCTGCGVRARRRGQPLVCGQCRTENRQSAAFCTGCGDRFLLRG